MSLLHSAIRAKEVLGFLHSTELDAAVPPWEDPRWERLRPGVDRSLNLRDRYRGALIDGAIGDIHRRIGE